MNSILIILSFIKVQNLRLFLYEQNKIQKNDKKMTSLLELFRPKAEIVGFYTSKYYLEKIKKIEVL